MWTILKGRETAWINSHLIRPRGRACLSRMHTNAHKFVLFLLSRLLCVSTLRSAASSSVSFGFARKVVKKGSGHRRVSFASTFFRFSEDTRIPRASRPSSVFEKIIARIVPALVHRKFSWRRDTAIFVVRSTLDSFTRPPPRQISCWNERKTGIGGGEILHLAWFHLPESSPVGRIFLNTGLERKWCFLMLLLMEGHAFADSPPFPSKKKIRIIETRIVR